MAALSPAEWLASCHLYLCTEDRSDLEAFTASCCRGGVDIAQLRDKNLEARQILSRAKVMQQVCADFGVPFILNDRPDLALELDADGVHVGQDDAPPSLARRLLGKNRIVGFSTHAVSEIDAALGEDCDYVSAGPVIETPTKPGRPGTGTAYIEHAARVTNSTRMRPMPFFVTGGVTPETVQGLIDSGARRFVAVRYLTQSSDPESAAKELSSAIREGLDRKEGEGSALRKES